MIFNSLKILRTLQSRQYLPLEELKAFQSERLRSVVEHAYRNVRYYRKIFDSAGIRPSDIRDIRDIHKIPFTTKKTLQKTPYEELTTRDIKPEDCVVKYTSGSTGTPMKFFFSEEERDFQTLLNMRIFFAGGMRLTDKTAYLINPHRFPKNKYWFQNLGILRRYYLSVFDTPELHRNILKHIRPDIIYGYPSNLTLLALLIKEEGNEEIRPKAVFSSAEALEPRPKTLIASVMDTDVYDILGLVETGDIAWECPAHEGYHINSDAVIMEFLNEKDNPVEPGQPGRLVCTSLYGYVMPLIRYEVGDICVPFDKMCSCGRTLPMMENIRGRANDFIVLPDGQIIASCFLVIIMQEFHDVAQYRIIQEDKYRLCVQIVKGRDFNGQTPQRIKEEIEKVTGSRLNIEVEILEDLYRDASGKIRTVVSKVIPNLQDTIDKIQFDEETR